MAKACMRGSGPTAPVAVEFMRHIVELVGAAVQDFVNLAALAEQKPKARVIGDAEQSHSGGHGESFPEVGEFLHCPGIPALIRIISRRLFSRIRPDRHFSGPQGR